MEHSTLWFDMYVRLPFPESLIFYWSTDRWIDRQTSALVCQMTLSKIEVSPTSLFINQFLIEKLFNFLCESNLYPFFFQRRLGDSSKKEVLENIQNLGIIMCIRENKQGWRQSEGTIFLKQTTHCLPFCTEEKKPFPRKPHCNLRGKGWALPLRRAQSLLIQPSTDRKFLKLRILATDARSSLLMSSGHCCLLQCSCFVTPYSFTGSLFSGGSLGVKGIVCQLTDMKRGPGCTGDVWAQSYSLLLTVDVILRKEA